MSAGSCPLCGGGYPGDVPDADVCRCGGAWDDAPYPSAALVAEQWEMLEHLLKVRSGNRCEARTPACLAGPRGTLETLPRSRVSIHHRQPRGAGGTSRPDAHSLDRLLIVCGHGSAGCHGHLENAERGDAYDRGLLVRRGVTAPRDIPLVLTSGRQVRLHPTSPLYLDATPEYRI